MDEDELICHADTAMYQAKMAGKGRYERFDPEAQAAMLQRRRLKEELRRAVEDGDLVVYYQPIVALATGEAVAAEALVRWNHPARGTLMPSEFVPLAEETGQIVAIGRFVLREACRQASEWQQPGGAGIRAVHVNLSAVELRQDDLIETVAAAVADAGIAPTDLVLEITESQLLEDADRSVETLHALRALGVRLALDDFGTGYSSLSYLHSLPLDILKIAKPFVDRLGEPLAGLLRAHDDRPRSLARPRGDRRGDRDRRAGRGAARSRVALRPGLLPRQRRPPSWPHSTIGPARLTRARRSADSGTSSKKCSGQTRREAGTQSQGSCSTQDSPAAANPRLSLSRHGGRPDMSRTNPSGRIRWATLCLTLASAALLPAPALAAPHDVQVIVQMDAGTSPDAAAAQVRAAGGKVLGRLPIVNGFGARLPAGAAKALAATDGVRAVTSNAAVEQQAVNAGALSTAYPSSINAPEAWNTRGIEVTGRGIGVAVIDTGIAAELADFDAPGAATGSRVVASVVTNPDATSAGDGYGHGTHVAGIVAGNSNERPDGDPLKGRYIGIAPEANLISVKVSDDEGNASVLDVIRGLQFVVDHKADYNIRVVNLSLESSEPGSYETDPLDAAVEAAWFNGHRRRRRRRQPRQRSRRRLLRSRERSVRHHGRRDRRPGQQGRRRRRPALVVQPRHDARRHQQARHPRPWRRHRLQPGPGQRVRVHVPELHRRRPDDQGRRYVDGGPGGLGSDRAAAAEGAVADAGPGQGTARQRRAPDQRQHALARPGGHREALLRRADRQGQRGQVPEPRSSTPRPAASTTRRSSWSRSSWSRVAAGAARAGAAPTAPASEDADSILPSRSSWSRSSWSTSWSK